MLFFSKIHHFSALFASLPLSTADKIPRSSSSFSLLSLLLVKYHAITILALATANNAIEALKLTLYLGPNFF